MLGADYQSPGMNALNWLAQKSLKPGVLDAADKINNVVQIQWSAMFLQMVQVGTLGICGMAVLQVFGMREASKMCAWLTVVELISTVMHAVMV
jgi:hypothetical protein